MFYVLFSLVLIFLIGLSLFVRASLMRASDWRVVLLVLLPAFLLLVFLFLLAVMFHGWAVTVSFPGACVSPRLV